MTEPNKTKCQKCNGLGRFEDLWVCGDPECCGTDMCYDCDGTGEVDEESDD